MIQSTIGHLVLLVKLQNLGFYKDLLTFAGWQTLYDDPAMLGVGNDAGVSLWFGAVTKDVANDYDGPGVNHVALSVPHQGDVDQMVAYLREHNVQPLFETPRHRPEFSAGPDQTYYQVMFESPDRILFEVVYTGPKE